MMTVMDYATMTTTGNTKAKPSKPIQQSKQFMYQGIFDDKKKGFIRISVKILHCFNIISLNTQMYKYLTTQS